MKIQDLQEDGAPPLRGGETELHGGDHDGSAGHLETGLGCLPKGSADQARLGFPRFQRPEDVRVVVHFHRLEADSKPGGQVPERSGINIPADHGHSLSVEVQEGIETVSPGLIEDPVIGKDCFPVEGVQGFPLGGDGHPRHQVDLPGFQALQPLKKRSGDRFDLPVFLFRHRGKDVREKPLETPRGILEDDGGIVVDSHANRLGSLRPGRRKEPEKHDRSEKGKKRDPWRLKLQQFNLRHRAGKGSLNVFLL